MYIIQPITEQKQDLQGSEYLISYGLIFHNVFLIILFCCLCYGHYFLCLLQVSIPAKTAPENIP